MFSRGSCDNLTSLAVSDNEIKLVSAELVDDETWPRGGHGALSMGTAAVVKSAR